MIFSFALSLGLLILLVYALLQRREFPLVANMLPAICLFGIYIAWFPEHTAYVAHLVGIGRGVDLMVYVWLLASGVLFLVLHLKLVTQNRRITELARAFAIAHASKPARHEGGADKNG